MSRRIEFSKMYEHFEDAKKDSDKFIDDWGYGYMARAPISKEKEFWRVDFSRWDSCD